MNEIQPETITLRDGRSVLLGPVGPNNAGAYCEYMRALAKESPWSGTTSEEIRPEEDQREKFAKTAQSRMVWQLGVFDEQGSRMIGDCVWERPEHSKFAHVASLGIGIREGWRGQGLGRVLMDRAILAAREDGRVQKLELGVFSKNRIARDLYISLGFAEEGVRSRAVLQPDGVYEDDIMMGLWVGG